VGKPAIAYAPRPDTTPETELSALCNVYKFIIEHANRNAGVPTSTNETILKSTKEVSDVGRQSD
jgi:hypothetical protein